MPKVLHRDDGLNGSVATLERGSDAEAEYMSELDRNMARLDGDFVEWAKRNIKFNKENLAGQMSDANRFYYRQIMMLCVRPLSRGVSMDTLAQSLGTYIGAALVSKEFRQTVKQNIAGMKLERVERQIEKHGNNPEYTRRYNKYLKEMNGGRMPFSAKSAALQEMAFTEKAYTDMRKPGANIDEIMANYSNAVSTLRAQAARDGVKDEDVDLNVRLAVGKFAERDPAIYRMFNETAYGDVERAPYQRITKRKMGPNGVETTEVDVWNGEFVTSDGTAFTGRLTPRPPMSEEEHFEKMMSQYRHEADKNKCVTFEDLADLAHDDSRFRRVRNGWYQALRDDFIPHDRTVTGIRNAMYTTVGGWAYESEAHMRSYEDYMNGWKDPEVARARWTKWEDMAKEDAYAVEYAAEQTRKWGATPQQQADAINRGTYEDRAFARRAERKAKAEAKAQAREEKNARRNAPAQDADYEVIHDAESRSKTSNKSSVFRRKHARGKKGDVVFGDDGTFYVYPSEEETSKTNRRDDGIDVQVGDEDTKGANDLTPV